MRECAHVRLRKARPGDARALATLEANSFASDALGCAALRLLIRCPRHLVTVASGHGGVIGAAIIERRARRRAAYVFSLAVNADARRLGLGRRLLERAETFGRAAGYRRLELEVRAADAGALAFYRSAGLRPRWTKPAWYADGAAALFVAKPISQRRQS